MNTKVKLSFEEYLDRYGELTYTNRGISMLPMLRQKRDLITLRKKGSERLKKYDVALFIRPPHDYVLHRVVDVRPKDYIFQGDNCLSREVGVPEDWVIGVLTSFTRGKRTIPVDAPLYRLYSRAVVALYPLRRIRLLLKPKIKRLVGPLLRKIRNNP